MHLASIDSPGGSHIGHDSQKGAVLEQAKGIDARLTADHRIATALERSLHVCHDSGLILDKQHWRAVGLKGW
jgi:hypothetical protein